MKDKFLIALVGILVVLVAFFFIISRNYNKDDRVSSFRNSLTTNVFGIELVADNSEVEVIEEDDEVEEYNLPLFRPENGEFVLTSDRNGSEKDDFYIRSNTCPNGVRIIGKLNFESFFKAREKVATLHIFGLNTVKSKSTFYTELKFSNEFLTRTLHLPSHLIDDNDSVFPEYRISNGKYSDYIRYDVICY